MKKAQVCLEQNKNVLNAKKIKLSFLEFLTSYILLFF